MKKNILISLVLILTSNAICAGSADQALRSRAIEVMKKAAKFYHGKVTLNGGYVYYYSPDLSRRLGEGVATASQIWVQPPGTPTVGMAYLKAFEATGDSFYLSAAHDAARALAYGQLKSGGWTNSIDFDPKGKVAQYRNGRGGGKNNSSFDDGQSQSAILLMIKTDKALGFRNAKVHGSAKIALEALLKAQFPNGGFPQVWTGPVKPQPIRKANYPDYDWRTEGRIKEYWDMYTLNDNVCGYIAEVLIEAHRIYKDDRYMESLKRLGNFLILAQMPAPQPGWAQQYNYDMQPIWARKFEPPAVSGDETQETIETLMDIYRATGDKRYLEPIQTALGYLKKSLLPNGQLARFYELKTNRPLYMYRKGKVYNLTYDDSNLPSHYGWKVDSRINELARQYMQLKSRGSFSEPVYLPKLRLDTARAVKSLDPRGAWITTYKDHSLVGQPKFKPGEKFISSKVFSENLETMSKYIEMTAEK